MMTSIAHQPIYEDNKTYPVVLNHRIYEMTGRAIKNRLGAREVTLTVSQYQDLLDRIQRLEDIQVTTGDVIPEWTDEEKMRLKEVLKKIFDIKE